MEATRTQQAVVGFLVAVPMVIWLAAPPMLQHSLAQAQCVLLVREQTTLNPRHAFAAWRVSIAPAWVCTVGETDAASFGWWATASSHNAELLP
jgi:hypothetical protein